MAMKPNRVLVSTQPEAPASLNNPNPKNGDTFTVNAQRNSPRYVLNGLSGRVIDADDRYELALCELQIGSFKRPIKLRYPQMLFPSKER